MNSGRPDTSLWGPGKAMFDDVYNLSDPAAYWQRLAPLDYQTPRSPQASTARCSAAWR